MTELFGKPIVIKPYERETIGSRIGKVVVRFATIAVWILIGMAAGIIIVSC